MHGLNSSYHALQVSVDKRYSHGIHHQRLLHLVEEPGLTFRAMDSAAAAASIIHSISFSPAEIPILHEPPVRQLLRVGLAHDIKGHRRPRHPGQLAAQRDHPLQSGRPFSIGASNNPIAGAGSARADLIGAGYPVLDTGRSKGEKLDAYFDKTRFANPAPNTYGTLGRNALFGPGFANIDTSLDEGLATCRFFGEAGKIEYRFEAFNLFNATHLGNPVTGLTNPNFGKITGTDGDPRILQMALKVGW